MSKQHHDPRDTEIYDNVLYTNWLNDRPANLHLGLISSVYGPTSHKANKWYCWTGLLGYLLVGKWSELVD